MLRSKLAKLLALGYNTLVRSRMQSYKLEDLGELVQGVALKPGENPARAVQVRHLEGFWVDLKPDPSFAQTLLFEDRNLERHLLRSGDVVLSLRNKPLRASVMLPDVMGKVASQNLAVLRNLPPEMDPLYVVAYLRSRQGQSRLEPLFQNSTAIRLLTLRQLGALEIPVPPLERQQHLAALMQAADTEKRTLLEQIEAREAYVDAVFARALQD